MNLYRALSIVDGLEPAPVELEEVIEAWQFIYDSNATYTLPGRYGRTVAALIHDGVINP